MGKVLITRSEPGASELKVHLQQHGFEVICAPLIDVIDTTPVNVLALGNEQSRLADIPAVPPDLAIFLSAHATERFLQAGLLERVKGAGCLAVGAASARALRQQGVEVKVPEYNTTEGLLEMPQVQQLTAQDCVWLLAGVGGRTALAERLFRQYGCVVVKFELYERRSLDLPAFDVEAVAAVVVSSEASLEVLAQQWPGSKAVFLVVPSARLDVLAREAGFQQVQVSQNASPEATLDILHQLKAAKRLQ